MSLLKLNGKCARYADCAIEIEIPMILHILKFDEASRSQSNIFPVFRFGVYRGRESGNETEKWTRKCSSRVRAPTLHHVMRKSAYFIYLTTETQTVAKTIVSRKNNFSVLIYFFLEFSNALNLFVAHFTSVLICFSRFRFCVENVR